MITLALDLGNTALKYGVFGPEGLRESGVLAAPAHLEEIWQRTQPAQAILSSVADKVDTQPWLAALAATDGLQRILPFRPGFTPVPLRNAYATPHTLGPDRLAAAVGAARLRPGQATLVLDAGTALKLDLVTADGTYHGGSIAPGLRMRLQALHTFTGRLPLLELPPASEAVQLIGDSTASCLLSGVLRGTAAEVRGLVAEYRQQHPQLALVLTGGDAEYLAVALAPLAGRIFAVPELVLLGLDKILRYNVDN
ncbi:type III pantothenate kinase [Hymenobacter sp. H14-R3]|uniref:type III pantothenate kinase n=1 Tax=Hymenobacter sp. H14-R3 TaxID=3046308 RepID=UPI0024BA40BD|nr:type III pantothenate kinase [Hymenobacter sp. H14-R3]MDJ0364438.1 type III pantothenate kinase [Hymenobacter sp. H14-R3]